MIECQQDNEDIVGKALYETMWVQIPLMATLDFGNAMLGGRPEGEEGCRTAGTPWSGWHVEYRFLQPDDSMHQM